MPPIQAKEGVIAPALSVDGSDTHAITGLQDRHATAPATR